MSDRSRYAQLPQSRPSTSSFRSVSLSSPPANTAEHPPRQYSFLFSSLSSVWSGLKAAAGVQAEGFWRGVGASGVGEAANAGDKRERADEGGEGGEGARRSDRHSKGKRRRVEEQHLAVEGDFLFDGVPPLMPPISHASPMPNRTVHTSSSSHFSSSPIESRSTLPLTSSPEARRRALRPYADQQGHDYEETLMHAASSADGILPAGTEPAPSRRSFASPDGQSGLRSLSGRRKISVQGIPAAPEASTSALGGRGYKHLRAQSSHAYSAGYYAPLSTGVPLPNPRHVHFAPIPSLPGSTSLPNLASIAGSAPTSREASKSPKTPRRSAPSPSSRSTSSSSASAKKGRSPKPTTPQVASVLFGDDMAQVWSVAKQEEMARKREEEERRMREGRERETQERREKRIRELEEEVGRLKGELSAKKEPASFPKSPRASFPPAPPPPPPPPVGRPHPLLLSIRQSLKATPPRPSQSNASKQKRRLSTLGGEGSGVDMGAFLEELGGRRGKLRKVGLPEMRKREGGKGGELEDVLQRAFARKFAHTASPSTPRLASSRSNLDFRTLDRDVKKPEWTSPRPSASTSGLTHSVSHPVGLAELAAVPPQPVFYPSSASSSRPPPRSSSLAVPSTETTVFGTALSTDLPAPSLPAPVPVSASISPSLSTDSLAALTSAPPELPAPSAVGIATPARPATPDEAASQRLSSARRRSGDGSPLPGLEMGRRRPMTPGRARGATPAFKDIQPAASSTSASKTPRKSPSSTAAATAKKRKAATPKTPREERYEEFEEEVLYSGQGGKEPEPGRVFGRA